MDWNNRTRLLNELIAAWKFMHHLLIVVKVTTHKRRFGDVIFICSSHIYVFVWYM